MGGVESTISKEDVDEGVSSCGETLTIENTGQSSEKFQGLADILFSWSLHDICNENLYKVDEIPVTFGPASQYFDSYKLPLLEETRAQLHSSIWAIAEAPFAEVKSFSESRRGKFTFDVRTGFWRNRNNCRGKEPYKTLPGDIFILADFKPEKANDLQRPGKRWTFVSVANLIDDDNDHATGSNSGTPFRVKASSDLSSWDFKAQNSLFVIFLLNITTSRRIWDALHAGRNLDFVNEVLCADYQASNDKVCSICSMEGTKRLDEEVEARKMPNRLDEYQYRAIFNCLNKIGCRHKSSVSLIWGPPGTGKTSTVSTMLMMLLRMKCRTLVCAPSNIAVSEVASRVLKLARELHRRESGNDSFCSLADILLFGNRERLNITSENDEIHLDHRVERLQDSVAINGIGWRNSFNAATEFFVNCSSQYSVYKEKEGGMKKSFLKFARERFQDTANPLRRCLSTWCIHVPESIVGRHNVRRMSALVKLLDEFETFLYSDYVNSKQLWTKRDQCTSLLKSIQSSLMKLDVKMGSVEKFCFQNACIIFCTAASAHKLNFMGVEPIRLLVIDEAAQLRECESAIAMQIPDVRHAVLIGDECQLPSTVVSKVSAKAGFGRSLFERLSTLGLSKNLLKTQYRMHPSISRFPNAHFYDNQIVDAPRVLCPSHEKVFLPGPMFSPFSFINVFGGREEKDDTGSRRNMVEVAIVMTLLNRLYKAFKGTGNRICIGVISPYAAQVAAIQERLGKLRFDDVKGFSVRIKSVDGFQGGEEDVIMLSTVRSNEAGEIGFLSDNRRANVALTRARHCLWILGNERTLVKSTSSWEVLLRGAKERNCFFNAHDDKELADVIIQVKKEYGQLDDLLDGHSELFRNSRWKVLFSADFRKSFRRLASVQTKTCVLNMILKLSTGWRPKRKNVDVECTSSSCMLKQFKVENLYIICSNDIAKDMSMNIQVLKVWDVLPLEDIPELVKRLDRFFARYTCQFLSLCQEKCLEGNLEVPQVWPASSEIVRYQCSEERDEDPGAPDGEYVEYCKVSESFLLMKFYSLSSGMASHLLSTCDDEELELPFEVNDEEMEVILFDRSMFLLGRSGSGKTTVLTTKLFRREQFYRMAVDGIPADVDSAPENFDDIVKVPENSDEGAEKSFLRQLFVTVSPKLCHAISHQVAQFKSIVSGGKRSGGITSVNNEFIDGTSQFENIPDSFVQIPADTYPLVISFEKFLMMLDSSVGESFFLRFPDLRPLLLGKEGTQRSSFLENVIRTKEVNYEKFSSVYWPHFDQKMTKHLDCSRVFTEIMSYIKGGWKAASKTLCRDEYVRKKGRHSTLRSEKEGELVYDIFEDYEKEKKMFGDFDLADLVIDLETRLENAKYEGDVMDFVYIDEVQDLTISQVALFRHICRNVDEGFVFAGDTAQTIARGIDFRFEDIRALFYKEFMLCSNDDRGKKKTGQMSKTFHLKHNFRTHIGVLKLAQTVIDLLYHFFPMYVDKVDPETSLVFGEAPVLLNPSAEENTILTIFGGESNFVGFGADQVILVRDETARNEIYSSVGKQALVLTILESKGLEFQDVLLYNFFGTSPAKNKWRVIYNYMQEQHLIDESSSSIPCSNILCSELKQLYVAITRTRQRLWICESDKDPKPMFEYWMAKGVVQVQEVDVSLAQKMKVASTPDEWIARGFMLLGEKSYESASMCFERAGYDCGVNLVKASGLKASAEQLHGSNPERACGYGRKAAEIFESIGKADCAAECFYMLADYERAGKLYYQCGASSMRRAGECFSLAGCFKLAAESYNKADCLKECLIACDKGKLFDQGLRYIRARRDGNDSKNKKIYVTEMYEQEFLEGCAYHFHKLNDKESMINYVRSFSSRCTIQNFLRTYECYGELVSYEEEGGHFLEAAAAARLKGDILLEADLFGKAQCYKDASNLVLLYVLARALWSSGQSKGWPPKKFNQMEELLDKAKSFSERVSPEHNQVVCLEADILVNGQSNLSRLMQCLSTSKSLNCTRGEIICCRMILDAHFCATASNYFWYDDVVADASHFSEVMLHGGQVSCETLVYVWNLWKENISGILKYLGQAAITDVDGHQAHGEFCLNYLGVRKELENTRQVYTLINPQAEWVQRLGRMLRTKGACKAMDVDHFVSGARKFWSAEFLLVGMNVLAKLEEIYDLATKNSVSHFCRAKCLSHIFDVATCLQHCTCLSIRPDNYALQRSIRKLSENIFGCIYPPDCKVSLQDSMICLRRTQTFRNFLGHVILEYSNSKNRLSYGILGDITLMILGSGRLNQDLCQKIAKGLNRAPAWKSLLSHLCCNLQTDLNNPMASENSLELLLHGALMDAYSVQWKKEVDYITPSCLLFLIERQLIELSSTNGFFFSTTFSVVQWLIFKGNGGYEVNSSPENEPQSRESMVHFLSSVVHEFIYNMDDTMHWIAKYHTKDCYAILVSRVVIVMCMLYLNFGQCKNLLARVMDIGHISRLLPSELSGALHSGLRCYSVDEFADVVAIALRKIGNPLVLVGQVDDYPKVQTGNSIIFIKEIQDAEDTLSVLLQEKGKPHQAADSDLLLTKPSSENGSLKSRILKLLSAVAGDKASLPAKDKVALEKLFLQCVTLDSCSGKNLLDTEINLHFKEALPMLEDVEHLFALLDGSGGKESLKKDSGVKLQENMTNLSDKESERESMLEKIKILDDQVKVYEEQIVESEGRYASVKEEPEARFVKVASLEVSNEELRNQISEAESKSSNSESGSELLIETNNQLKLKIDEQQDLLNATVCEKEVTGQQLASHLGTIMEITEKHSRAIDLHSETEARVVQRETELQETSKSLSEALVEKNDLNGKLNALQEQADQASTVADARQIELEETVLKVKHLESIVEELQTKSGDFEKESGGLAEANVKLTQELAFYKSKLGDLEAKLSASVSEKVEMVEQLQKAVDDLTQQLADEGQRRKAQISSIMEENNLLNEISRNTKNELQSTIFLLEEQLKEQRSLEDALKSEVEHLRASNVHKSEIETRLKELEEQLLAAQEEKKSASEKELEKEAALRRSLEDFESNNKEIALLQNQLKKLEQKLQLANAKSEMMHETKAMEQAKDVGEIKSRDIGSAVSSPSKRKSKKKSETSSAQAPSSSKTHAQTTDVSPIGTLKFIVAATLISVIIGIVLGMEQAKEVGEIKSRDIGSAVSSPSKRKSKKKSETSSAQAPSSSETHVQTTDVSPIGTLKFIVAVALISVIIGIVLGKRY